MMSSPHPTTLAMGGARLLPVAIVLGTAMICGPGVDAQKNETFEVVSVRPNSAESGESRIRHYAGGNFSAQATTLRQLIKLAYQHARIPDSVIIDGPEWIGKERFNIEARAAHDFGPVPPNGGFPDDLKVMLQSTLVSRFQLVVRRETRNLPIYALVRARADRLGNGLVPSAEQCPPPFAGNAPATKVCGVVIGPGRFVVKGATMNEIAELLSLFPAIDRVVTDETGLQGRFDANFTFEPAFRLGANGAMITMAGGGNLFPVITDALGLKLESRRGPVEVYVVKSAQQPSPN